jgi:HEAT repeat protein
MDATPDEAQRFLDAVKSGDTSELLKQLRHPDFRGVAVRELSKRGVVEAIPKIVPLLTATDPYVRSSAARALGRLRVADSFDQLSSMAANDSERFVREWALFALACIGEKPLVAGVVARAEQDDDVRARATLTAALLCSPDPQQVAKGQEMLRRSRWRVRRGIRRMVKRIEAVRLDPSAY